MGSRSAAKTGPGVARRDLIALAGEWVGGALRKTDADGRVLRLRRCAMACWFDLYLCADEPRCIPAGLAALDEIERVEALLSTYRPESELSRLNAALAETYSWGASVEVSGELWGFLSLCRDAWELTDGAFDAAAGVLSETWGFRQRRPRWPRDDEIAAALSRCGMGRVRLDAARRCVSADTAGVRFNPGAVGKGWALDQAMELLRDRGVTNALLSAGGSSVRAMGEGPGGGGWPVVLPRGGVRPVRFLRDAAMATSGDTEQFLEYGGKRLAHVIDPRTGMAVQGGGLLTVIVRSLRAEEERPSGTASAPVGREAAWCDALSTALFVMGRDEAVRWHARDEWLEVIAADERWSARQAE